jgi:hypothetical protein
MFDTDLRRWIVAAIAVFGVVALLAWARNDPGVGGREPDPPQDTEVVADEDAVAPQGTAVITNGDTAPPTT